MMHKSDADDLSSVIWRLTFGHEEFDLSESALTLTGVDDTQDLESIINLIDDTDHLTSDIVFGPAGPGYCPPWTPIQIQSPEDLVTSCKMQGPMSPDLTYRGYSGYMAWNHIRRLMDDTLIFDGDNHSIVARHHSRRISVRELLFALIESLDSDEVAEVTFRRYEKTEIAKSVDELQLRPNLDQFVSDTDEEAPAVYLESDEFEYTERS